MNLHEYQAKGLLRDVGVPVPAGEAVASADQSARVADLLGGEQWMVKAQVHAGGRGKAGGVKRAYSRQQLQETVAEMLGKQLVTYQSGPEGQPVNQVLIEVPSQIERELYLGALVDRASSRLVFMASTAGGMEVEEIAAKFPDKIHTVTVNPVAGFQAYQSRQIGFKLGLSTSQIAQLTQMMQGIYKLFIQRDLSMIEINPLTVTAEGDLLALDAKINVDGNALYRQPEIVAMRDVSQEDPRECEAEKHHLNYVALDGNIGCMVNGAGLAMATMDLIKLHGGDPANFLDVGGGTTAERVAEAFKLILSDTKVKGILVNIFGGIVRCDLIAEGIIKAVQEVGINIPVVVRLEGTNVEKGRDMLGQSGLNIISASGLSDAAQRVVAAVKGAN